MKDSSISTKQVQTYIIFQPSLSKDVSRWKPYYVQFSSDDLSNFISNFNTDEFLKMWTDDDCDTNIDDSTLKNAAFFWKKAHSQALLCLNILLPLDHPPPPPHTMSRYSIWKWILFKWTLKCPECHHQINFAPEKIPQILAFLTCQILKPKLKRQK